ncbi:MAG: hypothetical protein WA021_01690, partial [Minisyncoccia bacterium]
ERAIANLDGEYHLIARAVDAAGNVSSERSATVFVDTAPPRIGGFAATVHGVQISPNQNGELSLNPGAARFGISLEGDTATASVRIGETIVPLARSLESGLWEAEIIVPPQSLRMSISAADAVGNMLHEREIGTLHPVARGSVMAGGDSDQRPLAGARIFVSVFDSGRGEYVALKELTTDERGEYELALLPGSYRFVMRADNHYSQETTAVLEHAGVVPVSFTTEPFRGVTGYVYGWLDYFKYDL